MINASLGITPTRSLTVDAVHRVFLGIIQNFCRHVVQEMLKGGALGEQRTVDETVASGILFCSSELRMGYVRKHAADPTERLTRIQRLSQMHLGTVAEPTCETKVAQSWGFFLFLVDALTERLASAFAGSWADCVADGADLGRKTWGHVLHSSAS